MMQQRKIIEFKNVFLTLKDQLIFEDFNFLINSREKVVIFGKSGAGKSTLLNLLLGFKQPDSGEIFFNKNKINSQNIWDIRKQIAYVDQDATVGEGNISQIISEYFSFVANSHKIFTDVIVLKYLESFDLDKSILDKDIAQLSGGERQRLAIVVALLLQRSVIVLDESTSALDPNSKSKVISQLVKNPKITLLIITHDEEWKQQKKVRIFDFKEKTWQQ